MFPGRRCWWHSARRRLQAIFRVLWRHRLQAGSKRAAHGRPEGFSRSLKVGADLEKEIRGTPGRVRESCESTPRAVRGCLFLLCKARSGSSRKSSSSGPSMDPTGRRSAVEDAGAKLSRLRGRSQQSKDRELHGSSSLVLVALK